MADNSIVYLSEDITVKTILLPVNGEIILKPSVAINFVEDADCGGTYFDIVCACII